MYIVSHHYVKMILVLLQLCSYYW